MEKPIIGTIIFFAVISVFGLYVWGEHIKQNEILANVRDAVATSTER